MDLGPHAATIWACYGAVAGVLGGLALWLAIDGRRLGRDLADLERRGIRRRSAAGPPPAEPEPNRRT